MVFCDRAPDLGGRLVLSAVLDRAHGELARLARRSRRIGHLYDLGSDTAITALVFLGIGIGIGLSHGDMDEFALMAGLITSVSIALLFLTVNATPELRSKLESHDRIVDPDDATLIIAPMAWFGCLEQLLIAAYIGAPLVLVLLLAQITRYSPDGRSTQAE